MVIISNLATIFFCHMECCHARRDAYYDNERKILISILYSYTKKFLLLYAKLKFVQNKTQHIRLGPLNQNA
jgi:hypothetical protein